MTSEGLADVLAYAAAFGKSLDEKFDPARLLSEFSARAQDLIPHDCILIRRREDDGETWSTFAACAGRSALPGHDDSLGFERRDRLSPEAFGLGPAFEGQSQLVADITTDSRFGADAALRARMAEAGLRASVAVPLHAGAHVTGALVVMGRTAGLYTDAQVSSCRQLADVIGP
jgi:GAF domain-containing protein